jgi:hypothetical protein
MKSIKNLDFKSFDEKLFTYLELNEFENSITFKFKANIA